MLLTASNLNQQSILASGDSMKEAVALLPRDERVHLLEWNGERLWVKFSAEDKRNPLRFFSRKISSLPWFRFLLVNSALTTQQRFRHECEMFQQMSKRQLPVPAIVLDGEDFFVTREAGKPINQLPRDVDLPDILHRAFGCLALFHQQGMCHGRPAMRDILMASDGDLRFIDLEEAHSDCDPSLMARDTLLLLMNTINLPQVSLEQRVEALRCWAEDAPDPAVRKLDFLRKFLRCGRAIPKAVLLFKKNNTSRQILGSLEVLEILFSTHLASRGS